MKYVIALAVMLAGFLSMGGPAGAAGFDCAKASSTREKAICKDEELSNNDDIMGALYAGARARVSESAAVRLRDSQLSWLRFLGKACPQEKIEDAVECLTPWYAERVKFLAHAVTKKAGRTFVTLDEWKFIAPEKQGEEEMPGANQMQYRESMSFAIDNPETEGERAFNARVARQKYLWTGFDGAQQDSTWFKLNEATENFVSLDIFQWSFGVGAAHGNGNATHVNFRLDKGRPLTVADLFAKDGWQKTVAKQSLEGLRRILGDEGMLYDEAPETVAKMVGDPNNWVVTRDGLGVNFPIYSVGPYAIGDHTITTPWSALQPWLAKDAVFGTQ